MKLYLVDEDDMREASLEDLARWWIQQYPADIFVENPVDIVAIRKHFINILTLIEDGHKKKANEQIEQLERGV